MTLISEDLPNLTLFITVEKLAAPPAFIWHLYLSPKGQTPPTDADVQMKRLFRFPGTWEGLEQAFAELKVCDQIKIFAPQSEYDHVVKKLEDYIRDRTQRIIANG